MQLARSIWPKTGGDRRNSAWFNARGPARGELARRVALPRRRAGDIRGTRAIAVAEDGSLRVAFDHQLLALSRELHTLWRVDLDTERICSAPACLDGGATLIGLDDAFWIVDARGELVEVIPADGMMDDSGPSPSLTHSGALIATDPVGDVRVREAGAWRRLSVVRGYDVLPPAVFDDDTLALSCYAGSGFCRVSTEGRVVWQTDLRDADLLPTLNRAQSSAVGSINDELSRIFDPRGACVGTYPRPAVFSEYVDGGWIAVSDGEVARLSPDGEVVWSAAAAVRRGWGTQALVDREGRLFVPTRGGVTAFDAAGTPSVLTGLCAAQPLALAPVAAGELALICDGALLVLA